MKYSACSFTGHRIIQRENITKVKALLERAVNYIYENGCRDFYTGGALGFDTFAAEAVISLRKRYNDVKLHLILPCENQSANWRAYEIKKYNEILAAADSCEYISRQYYDGCMKLRNECLAERADVLVAYVGKPFGGSAQTLRMANSRGIEVFNLFGKEA